MPRPEMSHEQIWEVIAGLGQQGDVLYQKQLDLSAKIGHSRRTQDGREDHWQARLADVNSRMARADELRGRLRKLVTPGHRPDSMEWDV